MCSCLMDVLAVILTLITVTQHGTNGRSWKLQERAQFLKRRQAVSTPTAKNGVNVQQLLHFYMRHTRRSTYNDGLQELFKGGYPVNKIMNFRASVRKRRRKRQNGRRAHHLDSLTQLMIPSRRGNIFQYRPLKEENIVKREQPGNALAFDLGFVVDGSKAINAQGPGSFKKCLGFVKEVLRSFPVRKGEVHTGLLTYAENAKVNYNFDTFLDQSSVNTAIDYSYYPGTEAYAGNALYTAMSKLFPHSGRQNVPHVLVFMIGSSSLDKVEPSAEELRASGVKIFSVGVGSRYDQSQVDAIASSPLDTYVMTSEFDTLGNIVPVLVSRIINSVQYVTTGKPTQPPSPSLFTEGGVVEAKIDLAFLVDGSDTVGEQNYSISLNFLKMIYEAFWTRFGSIRVGVVVFGANPQLAVDFDNTYADINSINNAVNDAMFPGGTAAAGRALKSSQTLLFGSKRHDSYRRILVVIIGSTSEDDVFSGSDQLQANGVTIFGVGVGNQYELAQLDGIVSKPSSQYLLTVDSYANIASLSQPLTEKIEQARTTYILPSAGPQQGPNPNPNVLLPNTGTNILPRPGTIPGQPNVPTGRPDSNFGQPGQPPGQLAPYPSTPTIGAMAQPGTHPNPNVLQPNTGTNSLPQPGKIPGQPGVPPGRPDLNVGQPGQPPGQMAPQPATPTNGEVVQPGPHPNPNVLQPNTGTNIFPGPGTMPGQPSVVPGRPDPNIGQPGQPPGQIAPRPATPTNGTVAQPGTHPNTNVLQPNKGKNILPQPGTLSRKPGKTELNIGQPGQPPGQIAPQPGTPTNGAVAQPGTHPNTNVLQPNTGTNILPRPGTISRKPGTTDPNIGQPGQPPGQLAPQPGTPTNGAVAQPGTHPNPNVLQPNTGTNILPQPGTLPGQPSVVPGRPDPNIGQPGQSPGKIALRPVTPTNGTVVQPGKHPNPNVLQPNTGTNILPQPGTLPGQPSVVPGRPDPNIGQPGQPPGKIALRPVTPTNGTVVQPGTHPNPNVLQPNTGTNTLPRPGTIPGQPSVPPGRPDSNVSQPGQPPGQIAPQPATPTNSTVVQPGLHPNPNVLQPNTGTSTLTRPGAIPGQPGFPTGRPDVNIGQPGTTNGQQPAGNPPALLATMKPLRLVRSTQTNPPPNIQPGKVVPGRIPPGLGTVAPSSRPPAPTKPIIGPVTFPSQVSRPGKAVPAPTTMPVNAASPVPYWVTAQDGKLDITFLIDGSDVMLEAGFKAAVTFMRKVYSNFPIGQDAAHVALVLYGKEPQVVFNLIAYNDKKSIDTRLLYTTYPGFGGNMLGKGLVTVKKNVFDVSARPGAHHVLVIIAAGKSTDDVKEPSRFLRDKGVIIFSIGIGDAVDMTQLRDVVSYPEEEHLVKTSLGQMAQQLSPIVQNIRKAITDPVAALGPVGVRLELGFLLDVTTSNIKPDHFANVLYSIKSTYGSFVVAQDKTRIGITTYNGRPHVAVSLDQYTSIKSLDAAVDQITLSSLPGPGLLGQGLTVVKTQLFHGKTRPETPKILVVITAGKSGDDVIKPSAELKKLNTTIFTVGIGDAIDKKQLGIIATSPAKDHRLLANISHRDTAGESLVTRIRRAVQVDLGFLIDGSRNVQETEFIQLLEIIRYIYSAFPISPEGVQVGLGVISSNPEIIFGFNKYFDKPSLDMAVDSVDYPGTPQGMSTGQSLAVVKEMLFMKSSRKRARQVLVMLVSGKSQDDVVEPGRHLRDSGIEIYGFGVGNKVAMEELLEMASTPSDRHIVTSDMGNLPTGAKELIEKLQIAKVEMDQKMSRKPSQPGKERGAAIDLGIVIEGSDNTNPSDFEQIKEIVKSIYYNFPVSQNGTHVALAAFAEDTHIIFNLNEHFDHQSMDNAVDTIPYVSGLSRTGNALAEVKAKIFDQNSRKRVPRVLITIMTGKPDDDVEGPANELKKSCVLMFSLGLTSSYSPQHLNQASSEPHSEYVLISETFPDAGSIGKTITDKIKKVVSVVKSRSKGCVQTGAIGLDLAFIVDGCRNIPANKLIQGLNLVNSLYQYLPVSPGNLRVAIITVSNGAKITQDLAIPPLNLSTALAGDGSTGECTFGQAFKTARALFKRKSVKGIPQVAVIFLAGKSDDEVTKPARELQDSGVIMYTVGLDKTVDVSTVSNMTSDPVSEFFVSGTEFPIAESTEKALMDKLARVLRIGNSLVCPTMMSLPNECQTHRNATKPSPAPYSRPCKPQNTSTPPPNAIVPCSQPSTNATVPINLPGNTTRMGPVDLVFLVDGSDKVNETLFRTLLDIVRNTLARFPVSADETRVALAVYGTNTEVATNLQNKHNIGDIDDVLKSVKKPGGASLAGKALEVVKNAIFTASGRPRKSGVTRVLLHIMCGQSLDDVIQPAKDLREKGVKIVAAGACPEVNKMDLCNIGSAPRCNNSVLIAILKPPDVPGQELAAKLKEGVPIVKLTESTTDRNTTKPSKGEENVSGPIQPIGFWGPTASPMGPSFNPMGLTSSPMEPTANPVVGAAVPLIPSLLPVHPMALGPSYNAWNYMIPILKDPVAPYPYSINDNSISYRSPACVDFDSACAGYGIHGNCHGPVFGFSADYLMRQCKKSCGLCKGDKDLTSGGVWIKRVRLPKRPRDLTSLDSKPTNPEFKKFRKTQLFKTRRRKR